MMKRRKIQKGLLGMALTGALLLGLSGFDSQAADGYTYKVTVYAGNHGTFADGSDRITVSGITYGSQINLDNIMNDASGGAGAVSIPSDSKYYYKGVRESGADTSKELDSPGVIVDGDAEYVVVYGIKGKQAAYTVEYVDADGNALADSRTFYGNVGDKPVVAYQYIEGYQPQAYNLTRTLSDNEADNVFQFVYERQPQGTTPPTVITTTTDGGTVVQLVTVPAVDNGAAGGNTAGGDTTGGDTTGQTTDQTEGTTDNTPDLSTAIDNVTKPDEDVPQDLVDLDDEEVPQGNIDAGSKAARKTSVVPIVAGAAAGLLAMAALVVLYLRIRRKRTK